MTLSVESLTVSHSHLRVLADLNLEVRAGSVMGVLGANGSGKSTLLRTMACLIRPDSGQVRLDGEPLWNMRGRALARRLAFVPQQAGSVAALSVREAVMLGRTPHVGWRPGEADHHLVAEILDQLELRDLAERSVGELSGGQAQRVILGRALAQQPEVLLLDEPTSALDLRYGVDMLGLIHRLTAERDLHTVMAIHDLNLAAMFCDEVAFLHLGRATAVGPPAATYDETVIGLIYGVDVEVSPHTDGPRVHVRRSRDA